MSSSPPSEIETKEPPQKRRKTVSDGPYHLRCSVGVYRCKRKNNAHRSLPDLDITENTFEELKKSIFERYKDRIHSVVEHVKDQWIVREDKPVDYQNCKSFMEFKDVKGKSKHRLDLITQKTMMKFCKQRTVDQLELKIYMYGPSIDSNGIAGLQRFAKQSSEPFLLNGSTPFPPMIEQPHVSPSSHVIKKIARKLREKHKDIWIPRVDNYWDYWAEEIASFPPQEHEKLIQESILPPRSCRSYFRATGDQGERYLTEKNISYVQSLQKQGHEFVQELGNLETSVKRIFTKMGQVKRRYEYFLGTLDETAEIHAEPTDETIAQPKDTE